MSSFSKDLVTALERVLLYLHQNPFPTVENPEGCEKRASVSVILRVRPPYQPLDTRGSAAEYKNGYSIVETDDSTASSGYKISSFFAQQWVLDGDPEVLFIKRAARQGDRWSGHVALPGGRRDPEDADDLAAAVRETREEVGIDLRSNTAIKISNLPERVVTTAFGKKRGLMVLCPYVFLLTTSTAPELRLQPAEVAAVHWVPMRALLSPSQRTKELVDVSARFAGKGGQGLATVLHLMMGKMTLSAVRLIPSESLFASSTPGFVPEAGSTGIFTGLATGSFGIPMSTTSTQPLHLWGLTLGVLADFLDMLPPHNAVKLWKYPTFTAPDLRLLIYLFTRPLRLNNARDLSSGFWPNQTAADTTTKAIAVDEAEPSNLLKTSGVSIGGENVRRPTHAVGALLSGYYDRMNVAIGVFLAYRAILGASFSIWLYRQWYRKRP